MTYIIEFSPIFLTRKASKHQGFHNNFNSKFSKIYKIANSFNEQLTIEG